MSMPAQTIPLPFPPGRSTASPAARRYAGKHLWWHDAVIDAMLAHPQWTKKEIARSLNCTPEMIYLLTNSDLFTARFEQRRQEFSRIHDQAVVVGLNRVTEQTLDLIGQVLAKKGDSVPLPQLVDLADKTLNRLGYGVKPPPTSQPVHVNIGGPSVTVSADAIMEARLALRRSEQAKLSQGAFGPEAGFRGPEGTARQSDTCVPLGPTGPLIEMEVESEPALRGSAPSSNRVPFSGDSGAHIDDL